MELSQIQLLNFLNRAFDIRYHNHVNMSRFCHRVSEQDFSHKPQIDELKVVYEILKFSSLFKYSYMSGSLQNA